MKIRAFLAGVLLLASTSSALAAGPYIGAAGGVNLTHNSDISITGVGSGTAKSDIGYGFSGSVGYNFEPYRFEFEYGYKHAKLSKISGPGGTVNLTDTDFTVMSYMVNGLCDIDINSSITPYIGVGAGLLNGELKSQGTKNDDNEFGVQVIVGAAYKINKKFAVDLSYHFLDAIKDFTKNDVTIGYISSNAMLGLRYSF
jgi:opacity protein-like surface antigen